MKRVLLCILLCSFIATSYSAGEDKTENGTSTIQLIRNATLKVNYCGHTFLVDPMLSEKGSLWSTFNVNKNPRVHLTIPVDEIVNGVDFVLVSHNHGDHFDNAAMGALSKKDIPLYVQPTDSADISKSYKLKDKVIPICDSLMIGNMTIIRTGGVHGLGKAGELCGHVSGFVLKAPGVPTIYITGDVVYNDEIKSNIRLYNPDYIVSNSGGAIFPEMSPTDGPIIMDEKQTVEMVKGVSDKCKVIAVHMDALDHCQTSRTILRNEADHDGIAHDKLIIPEDGEVVSL